MDKSIIIIGLMGAGKTSIGKMLAEHLDRDFIDSDDIITQREKRSIPDIFAQEGEPYFRQVERDVISDLMKAQTPHVIGTGGGAFMNDQTRHAIKKAGISVFLKADLDILLQRVGKGQGRPLLMAGDHQEILENLIQIRHPLYKQADIIVETQDEPPKKTLERVIQALYRHQKTA